MSCVDMAAYCTHAPQVLAGVYTCLVDIGICWHASSIEKRTSSQGSASSSLRYTSHQEVFLRTWTKRKKNFGCLVYGQTQTRPTTKFGASGSFAQDSRGFGDEEDQGPCQRENFEEQPPTCPKEQSQAGTDVGSHGRTCLSPRRHHRGLSFFRQRHVERIQCLHQIQSQHVRQERLHQNQQCAESAVGRGVVADQRPGQSYPDQQRACENPQGQCKSSNHRRSTTGKHGIGSAGETECHVSDTGLESKHRIHAEFETKFTKQMETNE